MKPIVIKCGGSVFETLPNSFYKDIIDLQNTGWMPILVHGGGPLISNYLSQLKIPSQFSNGLRITTKEVLEVAEMVLNGVINKQIVTRLIQAGGSAIGLSGIDGGLIKSEPIEPGKNLGWVGKVVEINGELIKQLASHWGIPVISPIGMDEAGEHYNINADTVAAAIAKELVSPLCFISDVPGIAIDDSGQKTYLKTVTQVDIQKMIENEAIHGGMIPKVQGALESLEQGVPEVVILHGEEPNVLVKYANGIQMGTKIILEEECGNGEYHHKQDAAINGHLQAFSSHA